MGAYKKLNKQDVYTTTYTAHKSWVIDSGYSGDPEDISTTTLEGEFTDYGITRIVATGSYSSSLTHLYYPSKSEDIIAPHSYDYYYPTTLHNPQLRNFGKDAVVLSIPRDIYGTNIHPSSFKVEVIRLQRYGYVVEGYVEPNYIRKQPITYNYVEEDRAEGLYVDPDYLINPLVNPLKHIVDDGEGGLYLSGSSPRQYLGDIIYSHGLVILTTALEDPTLEGTNFRTNAPKDLYINSMQFKSSVPIYTHTYHCKIKESEFNSTHNRSAQTSSLTTVYDNEGNIHSTASRQFSGQLNNQITGSSFQPYITTVGLYNDANELIAIAKMGQPIPKSANTEMVIVVKIDT